MSTCNRNMPDQPSNIHFHRGKLSKACQACRKKRRRCDLQRPSCGACVRTNMVCTGYRDTETVRFNDQTSSVRSKILNQRNSTHAKRQIAMLECTHLPLDLQALARSMFLCHYVADFHNRTLSFVYAYQDRGDAPEHLAMSIDAVSLAFLSHQVYSVAARDLGRRRYSAALRLFNQALQNPDMARKSSTFQSALLFDLFEKLIKSDAEVNLSSYAHVHGALALAKLQGIEQLCDQSELRALLGISLNATIHAHSTGNKIPATVWEIRRHAAKFMDTSDPKWRLSNVILDMSDTELDLLSLNHSSPSLCTKSIDLDKTLERISLEASPTWTYERKFISGHDPRRLIPDGFFPLYDVYPTRMITQNWNVLRITRIFLCEQIIEGLSPIDNAHSRREIERAKLAITSMVREILASVPQMTNCGFAACHKLPKDSHPDKHTHTMSHLLDVYILMHPLYVVLWSPHSPSAAKEWALAQLHHISEHFGIKEASLVIETIQNKTEPTTAMGDSPPRGEYPVNPWTVYRLLGSYAFAAS